MGIWCWRYACAANWRHRGQSQRQALARRDTADANECRCSQAIVSSSSPLAALNRRQAATKHHPAAPTPLNSIWFTSAAMDNNKPPAKKALTARSDGVVTLEQVAEGYRAMDGRRAIKTLLRP